MAADVVLGRVCIGMQNESSYAQFVGQQHLCLFGLQILLDTSLGRQISALNGVGDLFLDKVIFFRSSLFFFRTTFFSKLGLWFSFLFLWLHLLFWCLVVSFLHLFLSPYICLRHLQVWGGCYNVEYVDLSTLVRAQSS
jgi:hypothetical protein